MDTKSKPEAEAVTFYEVELIALVSALASLSRPWLVNPATPPPSAADQALFTRLGVRLAQHLGQLQARQAAAAVDAAKLDEDEIELLEHALELAGFEGSVELKAKITRLGEKLTAMIMPTVTLAGPGAHPTPPSPTSLREVAEAGAQPQWSAPSAAAARIMERGHRPPFAPAGDQICAALPFFEGAGPCERDRGHAGHHSAKGKRWDPEPTSSACKRQPWCVQQVGHEGPCSASFMADGSVIS